MNANDYQQCAARTLPDNGLDEDLVANALGLSGEAGEVADEIKKVVFHKHDLNSDRLIKELGDVMWYVAALCTKLDIPLSLVMITNITKLTVRYPNGYSHQDSQKRVDENELYQRPEAHQAPAIEEIPDA